MLLYKGPNRGSATRRRSSSHLAGLKACPKRVSIAAPARLARSEDMVYTLCRDDARPMR